jgi:diguanylate cyclase (GGDEF)-like protein
MSLPVRISPSQRETAQLLLSAVRALLARPLAGLLFWTPDERGVLAWQGTTTSAALVQRWLQQAGEQGPDWTGGADVAAPLHAWGAYPLPGQDPLWVVVGDAQVGDAPPASAASPALLHLLALAARALFPEARPVSPATVQAPQLSYLQAELESAQAVMGVSALTELELAPPHLMYEAMQLIGTVADVDWSGFLAVQGDMASTISAWHAPDAAEFARAIQQEFPRYRHAWLWEMMQQTTPRFLDSLPSPAPEHPLGRDVRALSVVSLGEYDGVQYVLAVLRLSRLAPWRQRDRRLVEAVARVIRAALEHQEQRRLLAAQHEELRFTLAHAPLIRWQVDRAGIFVQSQGQGLAGQNLHDDQVIGQSAFELYRDLPELLANLTRALAGESFAATLVVNGRTLDNHYVPLRSARQEVTGVLGLAYDVTRRVEAEHRIQTLLRLSQMLDASGRLDAVAAGVLALLQDELQVDGLVLWRRTDQVLRPLTRQGQLPAGLQPWLRDGLDPRHPQVVAALGGQATVRSGPGLTAGDRRAGLGRHALLPVWLDDPGGAVLMGAYDHAARPWTPDQQALLDAAARTLRTAAQREDQLQHLEQLAHTDALTGVGNRRALERDLQATLVQARARRLEFSLVTLDVDQFKRVNTQHGHAGGDRLLVTLAGLLQAEVRGSDALYRLGGDEFVLLIHGSAAQVERLRSRLTAVSGRLQQAGFGGVELSVGAARWPEDAEALTELLRLSDERLFLDKGRTDPGRTRSPGTDG